MKRLVISSLCLFFLLLNQSCGRSYKEIEVKNYRVYLFSDNTSVRATFKSIVSDFNECVGIQTLYWMESPKGANSPIILTKGLTQRDGKVGWGQWLAETEEESQLNSIFSTDRPERVTNYTMRIELDEDYVLARVDGEPKKYEKLKVLTFHEIGHGLQMGHEPNRDDIMYYEINGKKNFPAFCKRAKTYMEN